MMSATFSSQQMRLAGNVSAAATATSLPSAASNTSQEDAESDNDLAEVESVLMHPAANHAMASPGMYTMGPPTVASASAVTPGRLFHVESSAGYVALRHSARHSDRHSARQSTAGEVAGRASSPRTGASRTILEADILSRPSLSAADAWPGLRHMLPSQASGSTLSGSMQRSAATLLPVSAFEDAAVCQAGRLFNAPADLHMLDMQQVCFFSACSVQLSKHDQSSKSVHKRPLPADFQP